MSSSATLIQNYSPYILLGFLLVAVIFLSWNIALQIQISRLKRRSQEFFAGGKVENLEDLLLSQAKTLKLLDKDIQELYNISNQINALAFRGFHKLGVVRFNPFKDVGGDQSFSVALLNGRNDGLTISSLFTREAPVFTPRRSSAEFQKNIRSPKKRKKPSSWPWLRPRRPSKKRPDRPGLEAYFFIFTHTTLNP